MIVVQKKQEDRKMLLSGQDTQLRFFAFEKFLRVFNLTFQFCAQLFQLVHLLQFARKTQIVNKIMELK